LGGHQLERETLPQHKKGKRKEGKRNAREGDKDHNNG